MQTNENANPPMIQEVEATVSFSARADLSADTITSLLDKCFDNFNGMAIYGFEVVKIREEAEIYGNGPVTVASLVPYLENPKMKVRLILVYADYKDRGTSIDSNFRVLGVSSDHTVDLYNETLDEILSDVGFENIILIGIPAPPAVTKELLIPYLGQRDKYVYHVSEPHHVAYNIIFINDNDTVDLYIADDGGCISYGIPFNELIL